MTISDFVKSLLLGSSLVLLVACSKEEPAATTTAPVVEETTVESTDDAVEEELAESTDDALEVVEESAAEPEDTGETPIILAQAETLVPPVSSEFREGKHYMRLVPSQPTIGGADKVEVAEFFWYGCGHCYNLEPEINAWAEEVPANVRFVRVPAMWNEVLQLHAQLYYTEEVLVRDGKIADGEAFRRAVFEEYHRRGNRMLSQDAIYRVFERYGVSQEDFTKTWGSFEVSQKLRVASDLARRYGISAVPALIVNGKYRTGGAEAGSYPKMFELVDELIVREGTR
jgi:thiol:disulfide interchange protein DsbA